MFNFVAVISLFGCRSIAGHFNQRFADKESVSKSFVAYTIKQQRYEIIQQRKKIKARPAYTVAFNRTWAMDLSFIKEHAALGVIEYHSRRCLSLVSLQQKTSVAILKALLNILEHTPKPTFIRTDNEKCFNSKLFNFVLLVLGIKHQNSEPHCPWQNGRIERMFGTLKSTLKNMQQPLFVEDIPYLLYSFEFWYNHIGLHQNLNMQTPASVYSNKINSIRDG